MGFAPLHWMGSSIPPLSIPQDRPRCGDNQNIQDLPQNRAREPQTPPGRCALTKPLSSMSYFLLVLLIPHKSSAACWPRSGYFPLLKTSFPRSSLVRAKFRSFLSGAWGGFCNLFLAKFRERESCSPRGLPHLHPGSGSPTPGPPCSPGGWKKWIIYGRKRQSRMGTGIILCWNDPHGKDEHRQVFHASPHPQLHAGAIPTSPCIEKSHHTIKFTMEEPKQLQSTPNPNPQL